MVFMGEEILQGGYEALSGVKWIFWEGDQLVPVLPGTWSLHGTANATQEHLPAGESSAAECREGRPQEHEEERLGHFGSLPKTPAPLEKLQEPQTREGNSQMIGKEIVR